VDPSEPVIDTGSDSIGMVLLFFSFFDPLQRALKEILAPLMQIARYRRATLEIIALLGVERKFYQYWARSIHIQFVAVLRLLRLRSHREHFAVSRQRGSRKPLPRDIRKRNQRGDHEIEEHDGKNSLLLEIGAGDSQRNRRRAEVASARAVRLSASLPPWLEAHPIPSIGATL
jgi:hypothetical protein